MNQRLLIWIPLTSLTSGISFAVSPGSADTFTVDCSGGGDHTTIQAGVDAAADGDTLLISPCTYSEHVVVSGKSVVLLGSGQERTVITWSGPGSTLDLTNNSVIEKLTVQRIPSSSQAVRWNWGALTVRGCAVDGRTMGSGLVVVERSSMSFLWVRGGLGCSEVTGSRFGTAFFSGIPLEIGHCIESTRCTYDVLSFGAEVAGTFQGGHIGFVVLMGGLDIDHELVASSTTIDSCDVEGPARLALTGCTLGNLRYQTPYESPLLEMYRCLVLRNLMVGPDLGVRWPGEPFAAGGALPTLGETGTGYVTGLLLEHNTIAGDLSLELTGRQPPTRLVQDNIIGGHATVVTPWSMTFSYNLIGGDLAVTGPVTFTNNYPNTDPQFCNPAIGDYRIAFRSPAVGAAHDGLAIGALGVGCTTVSVQPTTWGRLKALFH